MHPAFQSHFVTPDTHQPLSFHGTRDGARWGDGELVDASEEHRFAIRHQTISLDAAAITAFTALFFMGAYLAFLRYDVR